MKKQNKSGFYLEALLLLLLVLGCMTLLVQLMGAAQGYSRQARRLTQAALIVQNLSADFLAGEGELGAAAESLTTQDETQLELWYDGQGCQSSQGEYRVQLTLAAQPAGAGRMASLQGSLWAGETQIESFALERYLPGAAEKGDAP